MPPVARPARTWCRKASMRCALVAEVGRAHGVVVPDFRGAAREHDAAGLDQVGAVGEVERHRRVLLDQQDADALLLVDRAQDARTARARSAAPGRRKARRAAAAAAAASARATPRASAARRPRACRPAGGGAPPGAGSSRRCARGPAPPPPGPCAYRRRGAGSPRSSGERRCRGRRARARCRGARCLRWRGRRCARRRKRTSPCGRTMPQSARSVVVLPAPLAPSRVVIEPSSMLKLMPCSTRVVPVGSACSASCDFE